ncbi:MAG: type II secretory pathway pseudopilin PulG [Cyclobacteriaceae bacterium]|jgi:type II secretory pathway pseudopilin PulG
MNMTRIVSIAALIVSIILAVFLYNSIFDSINEAERIEKMENKVKNKLMMIREAQKAYQSVNGQYTSDWPKLLNFIDSGNFYIVSRIENIITLDYGADSSYWEIDTLGTKSIRDSLFSVTKYPKFDLASLPYTLGVEGKKFGMWADQIDKNGVGVDVVEVWNTAPVNPIRKEKNDARTKKPLRFGSRTSVTTSGNWE